MSLNVSIQKDGTVYQLQVDTLEHMFTRMPTQAGMPAENTEDPTVILLDFGIVVEQISLRGIVNTTSTGGNDPSKAHLEAVTRTWFESTTEYSEMAKLTISSGQSYYGAIRSATFRQMGALEDRWEYEILFLVAQKT